jgi:hypothetical protein
MDFEQALGATFSGGMFSPRPCLRLRSRPDGATASANGLQGQTERREIVDCWSVVSIRVHGRFPFPVYA